jgi:hypothetical protein
MLLRGNGLSALDMRRLLRRELRLAKALRLTISILLFREAQVLNTPRWIAHGGAGGSLTGNNPIWRRLTDNSAISRGVSDTNWPAGSSGLRPDANGICVALSHTRRKCPRRLAFSRN